MEQIILDRGFRDMRVWASTRRETDGRRNERREAFELEGIAAWEARARNDGGECGRDNYVTVVVSGVSIEECIGRHRQTGVHQDIDDLVMPDTAWLARLERAYAEVSNAVVVNGNHAPSENANDVVNALERAPVLPA